MVKVTIKGINYEVIDGRKYLYMKDTDGSEYYDDLDDGEPYIDGEENVDVKPEIKETNEAKPIEPVNDAINNSTNEKVDSEVISENDNETKVSDSYKFYSSAFIKKKTDKVGDALKEFLYDSGSISIKRQKELQKACDDIKKRYGLDCVRTSTNRQKGDRAGKTAICKFFHGNRDPYFNVFIKDKDGNGGNAKNISLLTGPYDDKYIISLDIDNTDDGLTLLDICKAHNIELPISLTQKTGSGNTQIFFKVPSNYDAEIKNDTKVLSVAGRKLDIDIRSTNGYGVIPPSVNFTEEGGAYTWINYGVDIAEIPEKLLNIIKHGKLNENYELINNSTKSRIIEESTDLDDMRRTCETDNGKYVKYLFDLLEAIGELAPHRYKEHGSWLELMFIIYNFYGSEKWEYALEVADYMCKTYSGDEYNHEELYSKFSKHFDSYKPQRKGLTTLENILISLEPARLNEIRNKHKLNKKFDDINIDSCTDMTKRLLKNTDKAYSDIFKEIVGNRVKYTKDKKVYVYDDETKLWLDSDDMLKIMIIKTFDRIIEEEMKFPENEKALRRLKKALTYCAGDIGSNHIMKVVLSSVVDVKFEEKLDETEPYILPIKDGKKIDLRTLEISDRTADDFFTFECPVNIDNNEDKLAIVDNFMLTICKNDVELKNYIQKVLGYFITGEICERSFFVWLGRGSNGKTTISELLKRIMFNYKKEIMKSGIFDNGAKLGANSHTAQLHPLIKTRLVTLSEAVSSTEDESVLDIAQIKRLTGGDTISVRMLYSNPIEIKSRSKIVLLSNFEPKLDVNDPAALARFIMIPFSQTFGDEPGSIKCNPLLVRSLENELLDSVFTWIAKGAERWYKEGLGEKPECVKRILEHYVQKDSFKDYIAANIVKTGNLKDTIRKKELYDNYYKFCIEYCYDAKKSTTFYSLIENLYGKPVKHREGFVYRGIRINDDFDDESKKIDEETQDLRLDAAINEKL